VEEDPKPNVCVAPTDNIEKPHLNGNCSVLQMTDIGDFGAERASVNL